MPIQPAPLLARDTVVSMLRSSLSSAEHGLGSVPGFVTLVVDDEAWRERVIRETGEHVRFDSFAAFVSTPPLEGLGATLEQLRGVCRDDPKALDAIDRATQNTPGRPEKNRDNVPNSGGPTGNNSAKALRRLRKDRPDLHARVLAGELSPHAAMIEAGFRVRTMTVPVTVEGLMRVFERLGTLEKAQASCRVQEWPHGWPDEP